MTNSVALHFALTTHNSSSEETKHSIASCDKAREEEARTATLRAWRVPGGV